MEIINPCKFNYGGFKMLKKNYSLLDQFNDRKCEVSFHSLSNDTLSATYVYNSFFYELTDECIILKDESEDDCVVTSIDLSKINSVSNLTDDFYVDVVSIKTNDYILGVCTLERKFIYPRCYKCGKQILVPNETIWYIHGQVNYDSHYDDPEENSIVNSLHFCDSCVVGFVGEISDVSDVSNVQMDF